MWRNLSIKMVFDVPLCGGTPRNDDVVKAWVELRAATDARHRRDVKEGIGPDARKPVDLATVTAERLETMEPVDVEDEMAKVWVGFSKDDKGLFVRGGSLRAHLKACADSLNPFMKSARGFSGLKQVQNFKSKITKLMYVKEDRLYLLNDSGKPYQKPTGYRDATLSVMTPLGPRTCLKRVDLVEPCMICATLQFVDGGEITRDHIEMLFDYGKVQGFGQDRSLQYGRYSYELGE